MKVTKQNYRIPVILKNHTPLHPIHINRALDMVKHHKAVFIKDRVIGPYVKLLYTPKDLHIKSYFILGIDPGSLWDGYTILNSRICINYEVEHSQVVYNRNYIKTKSKSRRLNRRLRRSRLHNRKYRIMFRTSSRISNTSNYYYQSRRNMIERLSKFYPIDTVSIEDIKFNHFADRRGKSFSLIEVGKIKLYDKIKLSYDLHLVKGSETSGLRDILGLFKTKNKSLRSVFAHCVDSYCIARLSGKYDTYPDLNQFMYMICNTEKNCNILASKRKLILFRCRMGNSKFYHRKTPHLSKLKKLRIKPFRTNSKHLPIWIYMYTKPEECFHKFIQNYRRKHSVFSKYSNTIYSNLDLVQPLKRKESVNSSLV